MRSIIPVVMAGVLGIYGLITAVIINGKMEAATYSAYSGYAHFSAGVTVGMSSLAAGLAIGVVGDAGVRANAQQPKLFVGLILILIFAEALGLYGLIVGLVVASTAENHGADLCDSYCGTAANPVPDGLQCAKLSSVQQVAPSSSFAFSV